MQQVASVPTGTYERDERESNAPIIQTVPRRGLLGSLVSRTLPRYTGKFPVGVTDIEMPAQKPRVFGSFVHRKAPHLQAGLSLDTVLFSLFYPAERSHGTTMEGQAKEKVVWFPKLRQTVDGFLRMASVVPNPLYRAIAYPIAAMACYGTTFPATPNAAIKTPPPSKDGSPGKWPVIIFSHGVGCSRLMYSAICGELASRGYIVAAIEHRDGTGPSSSILLENGTTKVFDFVNWKDLDWPELEKQPENDTTLRHVQLELRLAEVAEAIAVLKRINRGQGTDVEDEAILAPHSANTSMERLDSTLWHWGKWAGKFDAEKVTMMGHSLGGTTAIMAGGSDQFHFDRIVVQDPAIQRLEPWTGSLSAPLLVVNSEEFAAGMDGDFPRLLKVFDTAPKESSEIFHIPGSNHPSFSDIHLILPGFINRRIGCKAEPEEVLAKSVVTTMAFLRGRIVDFKNSLQVVQVEAEVEPGKAGLGRPIGRVGELQCYEGEGQTGGFSANPYEDKW